MASQRAAGWRSVAASVTGPAHLGRGEGGQDAFLVRILAEQRGLFLAVSDGAGSAAQAAHASAWLCEAAGEWVAEQASLPPEQWDSEQLTATLQAGLQAEAAALGCSVRDLAATLCCAALLPEGTWCWSVGDSLLLAEPRTEVGAEGDAAPDLQPVFWLQQGEYANQTVFVGEAAPQQVSHAWLGPVQRVALLTDGLHPVALRLAEQRAHAGFFAPLFTALEQAPVEALPRLEAALTGMLSSERLTERSDDDKTLVLASAQWSGGDG